jgi:tetratricopeptide (TPR) repeat protein
LKPWSEKKVDSEMKSPEPPNEAEQHLEQAYSYKEADKFEDTLREADAAIKIDPSLADAHNLRGIALEELGHEDEAIKAYKQAISLDLEFSEASSNLELLEQEIGEGRQPVTIAAYRTPVEANIAKDILNSEGIWSFISNGRAGTVNWLYTGGSGGVTLQVRKSDAERAIELLNLKAVAAEDSDDEADEKEELVTHHDEPPVNESPIVRYDKSDSRLPFFKKRKKESD